MSRLPITIRLTLVFAAAMTVVLVASGLSLYYRLGSELDGSVDQALRSRADDVAAFVRRSGPVSSESPAERLTQADESFAQVLDARGRVVGATRPTAEEPALKRRELPAAMRMTMFIRRRVLVPDGDPMRLLSTNVTARGEPLAVVVGASLDPRDDALEELVTELLIGGPAVLLLATLTAFGVARLALAPVESMRAQAAAISAAEPGRRLALPRTRDELWRLGATLNAMLARLEDALARERAFVSDASHELRTPLATLKMELALAVRHGGTREELESAVRSSAEEADRLVRIAEDLLVIARSEQHRLTVHRERNDVGELFAIMLERFASRTERLGLALEAEVPAGLGVWADRLRVEQALGNLLDNSLRYGRGPVHLMAAERNGCVELHVLDEGPGFPPEFLGRAFERFSRADEARRRGGAGLGLAVVEGIALAHGGSAQAANRASGGADVWLSLPLEP